VENRVLTDYNFETVPEQETIMNRSGMAFVMVVVLFVPCSISAESEGPSIPGRQTVRIGNVSTVPNGITTAPQLLRYVAPEYTDEARKRGIEGIVTVEVEFDINGAGSVLRVIQGLDYGLTENAIVALRNWTFAPADRNGSPVAVIARVDIQFRLTDQDLYTQANGEMEQRNYTGARLILQRLINTYPASDHLPEAKFAIADSFYREGTPAALRQARREFNDYLVFFPDMPSSEAVRTRLLEIQIKLANFPAH
jgi:TonB family protein